MSDLSRIVQVNVSRQTTAVTQKGFGVALLLAEESERPVGQTTRTRTYLSLEGLGGDYASDTEVFKAASAYFSQEINPEQLIVGFINGGEEVPDAINAIKEENDTFYAVGMIRMDKASQIALASYIEADCRIAGVRTNDQNVITVDNNITQNEIVRFITTANPDAGGFDLVINGESVNINQGFSAQQIKEAIESLPSIAADTINITGSFDNDDLSIEFLSSVQFGAVITIANNSLTENLNPISINLTIDQAGQTEDDDIAKTLNELSIERTFVIYNSNAGMEYPEFAWMGRILPRDPGSITWKFKTLSGVTPDTLSATTIVNLTNKKANFYHVFGGVPITEEGTMANGTFIDEIRGADFIQARMQENVFSKMVNLDKIPFTNAGLDLITNQMFEVLNASVAQGILAEDPYPTITRPDVRDIAFNDRAVRCVTGIKFSGVLAGAVHKVIIDGTLTV